MAAASGVPASVAPIGRGGARALLLGMQAGYLTLYGLTLYHAEAATQVLAQRLAVGAGGLLLGGIVFLALAGIAVRL